MANFKDLLAQDYIIKQQAKSNKFAYQILRL